MFKVLLVDDEPNVRQGVKMMIPWTEIDCEVIGEAEDGDDGLNKIMSLDPDIVVADIKMPGKTGIEMTQAAKALGFKGKVIILSGYSDFSYAKEAIALGVENFILKPVDEDELTDAIKAAGDKIRHDRERKIRQDIGKEYQSEQMLRGVFFGSDNSISMFEERYGHSGFIVAIFAQVDDDEKAAAYSQVREYFANEERVHIIPVDISGVLGVLFRTMPKNDVYAILNEVKEKFGQKAFISVGEYVIDAAQIKQSFATAEYLYKNRFVYDEGKVAVPSCINREPAPDAEYASRIVAYMQINDVEKLRLSVDKFTQSLRVVGMTAEKARVACITLMLDVRAGLIRQIADKKPENLITDEFISGLEDSETLAEMTGRITDELINVSNANFARSTKSNMERVVQYIKQNYNKELRLEMLAGIFDYNSAYLGKVFHQYTGDNFNNYLDNIRITEAKRLLEESDMKVYEVAEAVGYSNINYFHNKFKKNTGFSPMAYKKQFGHGE